MVPNIEDVNSAVTGKFYLVNTVLHKEDHAIIPIHGSLHEDAEIINFPHQHWHIDWRFISAKLFAEYVQLGGAWLFPWAWPINEDNALVPVVRRRLKCKRQFGPYVPPARIPWLKKLEDRYQSAKMKNFICPHKGLPCNGTPIVNGVIICRGHGLAFNAGTGEMVRQDLTQRY